MEQKILLISGRKQSGKDSAANYLAGYLLKQSGRIKKFDLDEQGRLLIDIKVKDPETNEEKEEWGVLDLNRKDVDFVNYASRAIWPIIKTEHFGDCLKDIVQVVFGLDRSKLYGSDEDKNEITHITWEKCYTLLPSLIEKHKKQGKTVGEFMTYREVMEVFGTDIARGLDDECWVRYLFSQIVLGGWPVVVIADCRFPGEVQYGDKIGAITVRLTRNVKGGTHPAETSLDNYEGFAHVIHNENMTQMEKGAELVRFLQNLGWVS